MANAIYQLVAVEQSFENLAKNSVMISLPAGSKKSSNGFFLALNKRKAGWQV